MKRKFEKDALDVNGLNYLRWRFIRRFMVGDESVGELRKLMGVSMKEFLRWMMEPAFLAVLSAARKYRAVRDERVVGKVGEKKRVAIEEDPLEADREVEEGVGAPDEVAEKLAMENEREWVRSLTGEEGVKAFDEWEEDVES
jgi:hypothetical protein